jgi:hypothetical protein
MESIKGKGWFLWVLRGLTTGNSEFVSEYPKNPNAPDINEIFDVLYTCHTAGLGRFSRRGWLTIDIPAIGTVQWKQGTNFRTLGRYGFLRINGTDILKVWPESTNRHGDAEWAAPTTVSEDDKLNIVNRLGLLD